MTMDRIYVVAPDAPVNDVHRTRYDLDDATESAARHNARFPGLPVFVWKIKTDGTLEKVT